MRTVGMYEAKSRFSQLVDEMSKSGESVVIQKRGQNVAVPQPYEQWANEARKARAQDIMSALAEVRASDRGGPESISELKADGRR